MVLLGEEEDIVALCLIVCLIKLSCGQGDGLRQFQF